MRVEPLNRAAWPDYPADAARYGNLAAVAMNFYIQTGNTAELQAAYVYARDAARAGNIALFAAMTYAECKAETDSLRDDSSTLEVCDSVLHHSQC
jgi:hypothetical protein